MNDNPIEAQYDLTKKSKLRDFYEKKKFLIYLIFFILLISIGSFFLYLDQKEKKQINFSNNYIEAKLFLQSGEKVKAKEILKKLVYESNGTYSSMSLFLILGNNLIVEEEEISNLFKYILENYKFDKETKNLIIYKKLLFQSNFSSESKMVEVAKPLLNSKSLWKPHVLMLLGEYFVSKKEYQKAKEFFAEILSIRDLEKELYDKARLNLSLISND